jgi:acyl-CoA reductase-like NAD-dependent aldehyde dehydrogenase
MKMYIGGEWVSSDSGETMAVENPAIEETIDTVPVGGTRDVDRAVAAARDAQPAWAAMSNLEKARYFHLFAERLRDHQRELAELLTTEGGKPVVENMDEIRWIAEAFEFYAELGRMHRGRVIPAQEPTVTALVLKEPCGVVAAIVPWNYPPLLLAWKIAPALVAGNTVVCKPPPEAPLTILRMVELLELPPGVVNVVTGGADVGEALVAHRGTDVIAFTGTVRAGRRVMEVAAQRIKRVNLELSGNDPFIVCDDVDVDVAVEAALWAGFANAGQICTSAERVYVMDGIFEPFAAKLSERASQLRVGNPLDLDTDIGPLATRAQLDHIVDYVKQAEASGAVVRTGGRRPDRDKGYFYEPTVLTDLTHEHLGELGEIFGPVMPIMPVSSFEEAIELANDSDMGLGANLLTNNLEWASRAMHEIKAGMVWINNPLVDNDAGPFGGYRMSGLGRELGVEGLDAFMETKHVTFDYRNENKVWYFPYSKYADEMGLKGGRKTGFVGGHVG